MTLDDASSGHGTCCIPHGGMSRGVSRGSSGTSLFQEFSLCHLSDNSQSLDHWQGKPLPLWGGSVPRGTGPEWQRPAYPEPHQLQMLCGRSDHLPCTVVLCLSAALALNRKKKSSLTSSAYRGLRGHLGGSPPSHGQQVWPVSFCSPFGPFLGVLTQLWSW